MDTAHQTGLEMRRKFLGEAWVTKAEAVAEDDPMYEYLDLAIEHVWGAYWPREGVGLRERSIFTIALLVGLEFHEGIELHVAAALRNGFLTPREATELILQAAGYVGFPITQGAMKAANSAIAQYEDGGTAERIEPTVERWDDENGTALRDGVDVWNLVGRDVELVRAVIAPGTILSEHQHPAEQLMYVLSGEMEYRIGDSWEGLVSAGEVVRVPPYIPHGGQVVGEEALTLIEAKRKLD